MFQRKIQRRPLGEITVQNPIDEPKSRLTEPTWMCVEGLLPQHIRNIISESSQVSRSYSVAKPGAIVSKDIEAITTALNSYQDALNASSSAQIMQLYAADGVFMAPNSPTAVGTADIRVAYDVIFATVTFRVKFNIIEVVPTAPNWAFARTSSAGTLIRNAEGGSEEANQELFVFQKLGGVWKIARCCFSTTLPPH